METRRLGTWGLEVSACTGSQARNYDRSGRSRAGGACGARGPSEHLCVDADQVSISAWMTEAARRTLRVRDGLAADASLVSVALARMADVVTSDRADIQRLVWKTRAKIRVIDT